MYQHMSFSSIKLFISDRYWSSDTQWQAPRGSDARGHQRHAPSNAAAAPRPRMMTWRHSATAAPAFIDATVVTPPTATTMTSLPVFADAKRLRRRKCRVEGASARPQAMQDTTWVDVDQRHHLWEVRVISRTNGIQRMNRGGDPANTASSGRGRAGTRARHRGRRRRRRRRQKTTGLSVDVGSPSGRMMGRLYGSCSQRMNMGIR